MFIDYFEPSAFLNVTAPKFPIYESKEEENPDEPSVRDGVSDSYCGNSFRPAGIGRGSRSRSGHAGWRGRDGPSPVSFILRRRR